MLFNKELLAALDEQIQKKHSNFNIQVFLLLLQSTTRPMGYPPYSKGVNSQYYLELIKQVALSAKMTSNGHRFQSLMSSLYHIMVCFCYCQKTLFACGVDDQMLALIFAAIDERLDTTDEECCAEKSLFAMLIKEPQEILKLFSTYHEQLYCVQFVITLQEQLTSYGNRKLKKLAANLDETTKLVDTANEIIPFLAVLKTTYSALETLSIEVSKRRCKVTIGTYLLEQNDAPLFQPWVAESSFLSEAINMAVQEKTKKMLSDYIAARKGEADLFSLFSKYPKAVKLSAADKFLKAVSNEKGVVFSSIESDAIQKDKESRLTEIYIEGRRQGLMVL
jgi:hypothetical protein